MVDLKKVISIYWEPTTGNCIFVVDVNNNRAKLCYPEIRDVVIEGITEITELHRAPGKQEFSIWFKTPTECVNDKGTFRCPKTAKMWWEAKEIQ